MTSPLNIQLALEDLLADLHFARKNEQLGRLALLAYCDVKRWAREAGKSDVADMALRMFAEKPCLSKEAFLCGIDQLLGSLQSHESEFQNSRPALAPIPTGPAGRPVMQPWPDAALG
jgi:hypothetical protein